MILSKLLLLLLLYLSTFLSTFYLSTSLSTFYLSASLTGLSAMHAGSADSRGRDYVNSSRYSIQWDPMARLPVDACVCMCIFARLCV
jgi:hypothetical protein